MLLPLQSLFDSLLEQMGPLYVLPAVFAFLYLFVLPYIIRADTRDKNGNPLPPGPLLRYAFLRPYPERALYAWSKVYGPLFSVFMGNKLFVVISDAKVARDLLVSQGAIFSSRNDYFMKNRIILHGRGITASAYNDKWRLHRKLALQVVTPKAVLAAGSFIDFESLDMISAMFKESKQGAVPVDPSHYAGRYALNCMLTVTFAQRTQARDYLAEQSLALTMEFNKLTGPWANIVDFIPFFQKIPTRIRSRGLKLHADVMECYGAMIRRVRTRMDSEEIVPDCLVKSILESQEEQGLDEEDMVMLAAAFTMGGVHSTSGLVKWFLATIPSVPHVARQAQEELDRVVGRDRWPTAEDESELPYIRALIKEVQRMHSPFWMGTPHCTSEDYVYNGMYIPKDTVIILNCWTIHHNPERYPDPHTFNPARYLGDNLSCTDSAKAPNADDRDHFAFGAGRRLCPGITFAEAELFLGISRLLWAFNFLPVEGEPISLVEYEGRAGRTPLPFKINLQPRDEQAKEFLAKI